MHMHVPWLSVPRSQSVGGVAGVGGVELRNSDSQTCDLPCQLPGGCKDRLRWLVVAAWGATPAPVNSRRAL